MKRITQHRVFRFIYLSGLLSQQFVPPTKEGVGEGTGQEYVSVLARHSSCVRSRSPVAIYRSIEEGSACARIFPLWPRHVFLDRRQASGTQFMYIRIYCDSPRCTSSVLRISFAIYARRIIIYIPAPVLSRYRSVIKASFNGFRLVPSAYCAMNLA